MLRVYSLIGVIISTLIIACIAVYVLSLQCTSVPGSSSHYIQETPIGVIAEAEKLRSDDLRRREERKEYWGHQ